jgi:hypothetical protein
MSSLLDPPNDSLIIHELYNQHFGGKGQSRVKSGLETPVVGTMSQRGDNTSTGQRSKYVQYLPKPDAKGLKLPEQGLNQVYFSVFSPHSSTYTRNEG